MPTPPLPQEILERLVDCASHESGSLKSLALTSPHFVQRCQSHLYRTLRIDLDIRQVTRDILEQKPSLLKLIREFDLTFDLAIPPAHALDLADRQLALSRVVEELQDLESIHIFSLLPAHWDAVSPLCQSIVAKLLGHPLRQMALVQISGLPLRLAHSALTSTVERCTMLDSFFDIDDAPAGIVGSRPLQVKTLRCEGSGILAMMQLLGRTTRQHPPTLDSIVSLHLNSAFGDSREEQYTGSLAPLLQSCSRLKALTLEYPSETLTTAYRTNFTGGDLGLPTIPSLRYLHVHVSTQVAAGRGQGVSPVIPRFLCALLSEMAQLALEVLDIQISWIAYPPPSVNLALMQAFHGGNVNDPLLLHCHHWGELDEVLSNAELYPKLHAVRFTPDVQFASPDDTSTSKVPGLFQEEVTAVMVSTRGRLLGFDAGGEETEAGKAFNEARKSIFEQDGVYYT